MSRRTHLLAALNEASHLRQSVKEGMGAFLKEDIKLVAQEERPRIDDSLDLDGASKDEFPQANRWDYILSVRDSKELVGIEPHSAKDSEISVVIAKKKHASQYLQKHLKDGHRVKRWFWVSHGTVSFSRMDPARRRLDQNGIEFVGRTLLSLGKKP